MRSSRLRYCVFVFWCFLQLVRAEQENIALHKPVIGSAAWKECLTDGKLVNSVISPEATQYPFYAVDLGGLYNLTEIRLYAQNQGTFGNQGIGEKFNVSTYGEFVSACELHVVKWDELAINIRFEKKGEAITLKPTKLAQYVIVWRENPQFPGMVQPIVMGELMAFGEKVRDTVPKIPEDDEPEESPYITTRREVIGTQDYLRVDQSFGSWKPNPELMDVPFGWHGDYVNAMAVKREKGRVIVILGEEFVSGFLRHHSYYPLRKSLRAWLSPGTENAQFYRTCADYKEKDIIVIKRDDKFDVEKVYNQIISGQNGAIISYLAKDETGDTTTLLQKLGIEFYKHEVTGGQFDMYLQNNIDTMESIPLKLVLKYYTDSWKLFRTRELPRSWSLKEWESDEVQAALKVLVEKYLPLMRTLAPCELKGYKKDPKTLVAVKNYNYLLNQQNADRITPLPGVQLNPGTVDDNVKPTTVTVTVNSDFKGNFYPTGAYVKPGEGFSWKVISTSRPDFNNMFIRINAQADDITRHDDLRRWLTVVSKRRMTENGHWASAHGGPIFLDLEKNINVTIQFEKVYRHAYVDVRDPKSVESFGSELQEHKGVPWFIVMGDAMYSMLHIRSSAGRSAQDILNSTIFFDNCIKIIHNYRGSDYANARPEVFVNDVQISAGWGHSGYPWMGHLPWSDLFTDWKEIKKNQHWGYIHELGHNLQVRKTLLKGGIEVTNNIYIMPCTHFLLGKSNDKLNAGDVYTDGYMDAMINSMWKGSSYVGPTLGYYAHLTALFGEGLIGNIFKKAASHGMSSEDEDAKTQFWVQQVCQETGLDMVPYHQLSHFPMSQETIKFCQKFTCFMPDDEITRRLPNKIDEVLKAYGRECTRSGQKKVKFNGDIMRGVNQLRPQVVFVK